MSGDEQAGTYASVSRYEQYYDVLMTMTADLGPPWFVEDRWPGATFIREKFDLLRYNADLCMPFD